MLSFQRLRLKNWMSTGRLLPLLTILGAGSANVLSLIGIVPLSTPEEITIALLGLLAVDSLVERSNILERIEKRLNNLSAIQTLQPRANIPKPIENGQHATEIIILGVHIMTAFTPYIGFYEERLRAGCRIRFILIDPGSSAIENFNLLKGHSKTRSHIEVTLGLIQELNNKVDPRNKCEVRLASVLMPYSIFAVDINSACGSMIVEYQSYRVSIDDRPHVQLTVRESPYWFDYYRRQLESIWSESAEWNG
jgi:hypothetical protein